MLVARVVRKHVASESALSVEIVGRKPSDVLVVHGADRYGSSGGLAPFGGGLFAEQDDRYSRLGRELQRGDVHGMANESGVARLEKVFS